MPADAPLLYEVLASKPYSFLLDSSLVVGGLGHYSFIGVDPFLIFHSKGHRSELITQQGKKSFNGHPLSKLKKLLHTYKLDAPGFPFPFCGGAVGYFSYDMGRLLEKIPERAVDDLLLPDLCLGFYDVIVAIDRVNNEVFIISTGLPETERTRVYRRARERLCRIHSALAGYISGLEVKKNKKRMVYKESQKNARMQENDIFCHFNQDSYCRIIQRAREYIKAGEIYQVNLSQRFSLHRTIEPWTLYRRLRAINPAPMAAYMDFGNVQVISASPERFLKITGKLVETRPIKGTRPRGRNAGDDLRLRNELWQSEKDRAELLMIVDLERNDLGRVCQTGSVQVPELFRLEEYATVFHLVSTVVGKLPADKDAIDLLEASFPGGSITGAPKIRAMEIIEELEPVRRGIYTGSIGYLSFNGNADLNIVIRTIIVKNEQIYFQVGGGITSDSDPIKEHEETLDKALALMIALGLKNRSTS